MFNERVDEKSSEFRKIISPDNFIYKYKTEGIYPKDFRNDQDLIKLFKDLRDGNINPKEVLKDQINFKSDFKSKNKISVIQNVEIFFLRKKIIDFLEIILFSYLKLNTKQNMEKVLNY